MALVTTAEAKTYFRADDDIPEAEFEPFVTAAEAYLIGGIGVDLSGDDYSDASYDNIKKVAKQAIMMLAVQWYRNRSGDGKPGEPTYGITALIAQVAAGVL